MSYRDILAQTAADIGSSVINDVGDTYQEILMAHASLNPPDGTGAQVWEQTTDPAPESPMNDQELTQLIASQPEQQPAQPTGPEPQPDFDIEPG